MKEKSKEQFWKDFKKDFIAGSASGAAVTLATQPLDTVAVRAQAGTGGGKGNHPRLKKIKSKTKSHRIKGLKGLYRGVGPRLLKSTAAGAIGYPVFMAAADKLEKNGGDMKVHRNMNPGQMTQLSHTDSENEFREADPMPTEQAMDHISKTVLNRPGAFGSRKYKLHHTELKKEGFWAAAAAKIPNFVRGMIGASSKSGWRSKSYLGGNAATIGALSAKPQSTSTSLEKAVKMNSGFKNIPTLRNMNPSNNKLRIN